MVFESRLPGSGGFLVPQVILSDLGIIKKGLKVADFGCGHGYFTLPLSRLIGDTGKVFAIDILPEALEVVESKAKIEGIQNIETKRCDLEKKGGCDLKENLCDIVLIINILFQTEKDDIVIKEAKRILKDKGLVIFIEWRPDVSLGPQGKRLKKEESIKLFENEGFNFQKEFPTDNYHYGLIFQK